MTAGEASHPAASSVGPDELARMRPKESAAALEALGLVDVELECLGVPDGSVTTHERGLAAALAGRLHGCDLVCTTAGFDGHVDHESHLARGGHGPSRPPTAVLEFPVWMWHWALPYDERVPWHRCQRLDLAVDQREAKAPGHRLSSDAGGAARLGPRWTPPSWTRRWWRTSSGRSRCW